MVENLAKFAHSIDANVVFFRQECESSPELDREYFRLPNNPWLSPVFCRQPLSSVALFVPFKIKGFVFPSLQRKFKEKQLYLHSFQRETLVTLQLGIAQFSVTLYNPGLLL